ncbi:MAG: beta-galactosidase [Lentisphaeria bacterium]|nr:beta-galactosidase [Lentisphaeria bacterium]
MLKKIIFFSALFSGALLLTGAEFEINSGRLHFLFDTSGGGIKSIKAGKQEYNYPHKKSFTERFFALQEGEIRFERFTDLEFSLDKFGFENRYDQRVILSAGGISSFDWLRVTKNYFFPKNKNYFTLTYTLKNRDSKPHSTAMWLQTYLGPADESGARVKVLQPRKGKLVELTNPGNATANEWSAQPGVAVSSVCGKDDPAGLMLTLPGSVAAGYYCWNGNKNGKPMHSFELMTREWNIAPGKEVSFTVRVDYDKDISKKALALAKNPAYKIPDSTPAPVAIPDKRNLKWLQPKGGELPDPQRYVDIKLKRQFRDSIRAVQIPAGEKIQRAAVFPVRNGRIDRDRPFKSVLKTLPDGSKRLLFEVPGFAPKGYYYTRIQDNFAYDVYGGPRYKRPLGMVELKCRVVLDSPVEAPRLNAEIPNLIPNGDLERPNAKGNFAAENFWHANELGRNVFKWGKGLGKDGSCGIKLYQGNPKYHAAYGVWVLVEPGIKYNLSADMTSENSDRKYIVFSCNTQDAAKKIIADPARRTIGYSKSSFPWKRFTGYVVPSAQAVYLSASFRLQQKSRDNTLQVDNVVIAPEDFQFVPKLPLEAAREKAILSGYLPLANLEKISHELVTWHEKWFKPMAEEMPELLYACSIIGSNEDASRREIVELAQRMDLKYTFIPLLPKCLGFAGNGTLGVNKANLDKVMCEYSIERFRALKKAPKAALIQGINFKRQDTNGELAAEIAKLQKNKCNIIFLNCESIPQKLLGKRGTNPAHWQIIPAFKSMKNFSRYVRNFRNAVTFSLSNPHYLSIHNLPSTPAEYTNQSSPAYISRDFPFWEYRYLPLMKAIIERSGVKMPVKMLNAGQSGKELQFQLQSTGSFKGTLEVVFKSMDRHCDGKSVKALSLAKGKQQITLPLPQLPGGTHIAHIRILNSKGGVCDAGAIKVTTPEIAAVKVEFAKADRCYSFKAPVNFTVKSAKFLNSDKLVVRIEDSEFREVFRAEKKAAAELPFTLKLHAPFTTLNRVIAELYRNGKLISRNMGEFSFSDRTLDPTDYHAGMWGGRPQLTPMLRNLGFDLFSGSSLRNNIETGYMRNLITQGFFPLMLNFGAVAVPRNASRTYRGDVATDPVRVPCYSDPVFTKKADDLIKQHAETNQMRYYTCIYHHLGDEMFLGSTVCFSEHCLKNFRAEMQKQYKTIADLNAVWGRNYKSFDEVTPVQRKEVENSSNLAPWLDHKVFMSRVYAERFIGARAKTIQKHVPGAKVGMSGTQIPGYGYDWWQLMKHIGCIAYYSGVQRTLVNDFGPAARLFGQWGGGYTSSHTLYEPYQRAPQWSNLFMGANISWNWHGSAYNGDGSPTENLKAYADEFNLLKKGLAKLLLGAKSDNRQVAVLYSQASLFAAMAGGIGISEWQNTQTGWNALLRDLKINFRFISYEQLSDSKFDLSNFKVIVLPMVLAISDAERARLVKFAEKGGVVIADVAPGRYDNHGKRIAVTVLDKLFPANAKAIDPKTVDLSKGTLQGKFRIAEPAIAPCFEKRCGKGKGILLNIMLNSYQAVTLGGVGGETATAKSGSALYCDSMQKTLKELLSQAGIKPHAVVTDSKGNLVPSESVLKTDTCNNYFGLLRGSGTRAQAVRIDHKNAPVVTVKLPVSGVIYDVRTGKLLAKGNTFKVKAPYGYGQLFAVLPQEVKAPFVKMASAVKAGNVVTLSVQAPGAQGASVYRVEVRDPAGKEMRIYAKNTRFETPAAKFAFQLPFNAACGKWQVTVIHVASQQKTTIPLTVVK